MLQQNARYASTGCANFGQATQEREFPRTMNSGTIIPVLVNNKNEPKTKKRKLPLKPPYGARSIHDHL